MQRNNSNLCRHKNTFSNKSFITEVLVLSATPHFQFGVGIYTPGTEQKSIGRQAVVNPEKGDFYITE